MNKMILLAALALPAFAQSFDFSLLDRLGTNAKNHTEINLDPSMMKLASGMIGNDKDGVSMKTLLGSLKGITIRTFEFDKAGKYNEADLEPFRAFLKQGKWNRIVDSSADGEHSEIYVQPLADSKVGGLAIVAAEPREVTIVFINGPINMDDLEKLGGTMGIPDIKLDHSTKSAPKGKKEE